MSLKETEIAADFDNEDFNKVFNLPHYKGAKYLLNSMSETLAKHRNVEREHPGDAGVIEAARDRKKLILTATLNMKELLKLMKGIYRSTSKQKSKTDRQEYFKEAYGLALNLQHDLERAHKIPLEMLKYRIDPSGNLLELFEKRQRKKLGIEPENLKDERIEKWLKGLGFD